MTNELNERIVEEVEVEAMEIPGELIGLPEEHKRKLHKWLKRRYYAIHILQRTARYAEGFLDDYVLSVEVDRSSINPRLVIEVKMDKEIPMEIAAIVYKYIHELTDIFDYLNTENWKKRKRKAAETKEFRWREPQEVYQPYP